MQKMLTFDPKPGVSGDVPRGVGAGALEHTGVLSSHVAKNVHNYLTAKDIASVYIFNYFDQQQGEKGISKSIYKR